MKNPNYRSIKSTLIPGLLAACLVLCAGCDDELSRYPLVAIPEYEAADYVADLSSPHPEVVFNAVSALGRHAKGFGQLLSDEKTDRVSVAYRAALEAYRKIKPMTQSRQPQLAAVSLRFLQDLGAHYQPKSELLAAVSQVRSAHPLVQYEQLLALGALASDPADLPVPLVTRLLNSSSWIVSRNAYALASHSGEASLRQELMRRYAACREERERLLILAALQKAPGAAQLGLFLTELLASQSAKIRRAAAEGLVMSLDKPGVAAWLSDHIGQLRSEDRQTLFEFFRDGAIESELAADLIVRLLAQGHVSDPEYLKKLKEQLEKSPANAGLLRIEKAVRSTPALASAWSVLCEKRSAERARIAAWEKENEPLARQFAEQAAVLFKKHGIPAETQERYLSQIASLKQYGPR